MITARMTIHGTMENGIDEMILDVIDLPDHTDLMRYALAMGYIVGRKMGDDIITRLVFSNIHRD